MADKERENWGKWTEFFFSVLGSMVGLANIWRFPYLCYKNGGGAFLVPFFLFLFFGAVPLLFVELAYSQYSNLGPGKVWILCPLFKGIGYGMVILANIISIYYTVILAWALYYLYMSMQSVLPWTRCNNPWNTWQCYETIPSTNRSLAFQKYNETNIGNLTGLIKNGNSSLDRYAVSASEQFWKHHVLEITSGVEEIGGIRYPLLLCLAIAWIIVFLCLIKGIKSSGKVVYVAATMPYVFLTILLCRAVTLPGSKEGLLYYMWPKWEKLKEFSVWKDGAVQIFYSAGVGVGGIATLASYNDFHNNCQRDAFLFPIIDGFTSWFAGLTTFCILGYMAHISNTHISNVVTQGPGVAFIVYPEALSTLPFAQLWSSLFFIMLFFVGMDSQFVHVQILVTALTDMFPKYRTRKMLMTGITCIVTFLLGIPCVTQGGVYVLQILDWYCASVSLLFLAFMEAVGVCWIYGIPQLYKDITLMLGYKPLVIWKPLCMFMGPLVALACWIITLIAHSSLKYDSGEPFPVWVSYCGVVIALMSVIPFPVAAIVQLFSLSGSFGTRLKVSLSPTPEWGPAIKEYRTCDVDDIRMSEIEALH